MYRRRSAAREDTAASLPESAFFSASPPVCLPQPPSPLQFQVPVIQVMLGQLGVVSSDQMFSAWRYVVVGATVAAAVLTPSTDPFTQVKGGERGGGGG